MGRAATAEGTMSRRDCFDKDEPVITQFATSFESSRGGGWAAGHSLDRRAGSGRSQRCTLRCDGDRLSEPAGWGALVTMPPESIEVGRCYLTRNDQVVRVMNVLSDGYVVYAFRSSAVAKARGWT